METKDVLLELRIKHGLSQDELAEKVFVTRQAVSRWENGDTVPNTETLKLLSKLFNVSINTLLGSPRELICQCCGMPLNDEIISHNSNGTMNEDYCKWCYADGTYTYNVTLPPDNEIWYTSVDGNVVELSSYPATLVSNTYNNGRGVYTFASNVTSIGGVIGNDRIESVILPKTVTRLGSYSLHMLNYAHTLVLSPNITSIDTDVFGRLGEGLSEDHINHIYFLSEQCPSPGWRAFWNLNGIVKIHYPKGADYSVIEQAAKEWGDANNKFKWEMVETKYIYNQ